MVKQVSKVRIQTKGQSSRTGSQYVVPLDKAPVEFALEAPLERPLLSANDISCLWMHLEDSVLTIASRSLVLAAGVLTAARRPATR
jgi:hypothetical protein